MNGITIKQEDLLTWCTGGGRGLPHHVEGDAQEADHQPHQVHQGQVVGLVHHRQAQADHLEKPHALYCKQGKFSRDWSRADVAQDIEYAMKK